MKLAKYALAILIVTGLIVSLTTGHSRADSCTNDTIWACFNLSGPDLGYFTGQHATVASTPPADTGAVFTQAGPVGTDDAIPIHPGSGPGDCDNVENDAALPNSCANVFVSLMNTRIYSATRQDEIGAAFIIDTFSGMDAFNNANADNGIAIAKSSLSDGAFKDLVEGFQLNGLVDWASPVTYHASFGNSYYGYVDSPTDSNGDDAFYQTANGETQESVKFFYQAYINGPKLPFFEIKKNCGNITAYLIHTKQLLCPWNSNILYVDSRCVPPNPTLTAACSAAGIISGNTSNYDENHNSYPVTVTASHGGDSVPTNVPAAPPTAYSIDVSSDLGSSPTTWSVQAETFASAWPNGYQNYPDTYSQTIKVTCPASSAPTFSCTMSALSPEQVNKGFTVSYTVSGSGTDGGTFSMYGPDTNFYSKGITSPATYPYYGSGDMSVSSTGTETI
ncbi:MAG TPA: hypothetical protein VMQ52_02465, partial [Candidatus Saccharimonadales bacterium]|nr:hypothetical protein [Candidatus Saccharimonadales bacterium]